MPTPGSAAPAAAPASAAHGGESSRQSLTEIAVRNSNDIQAALNTAVALGVQARPKNTSRSYEPRQQRFKEFCDERAFVDGTLVTEGKILLWLQEDIIKKGNLFKGKGKAKKQSDEVDDGQPETSDDPVALASKTIDGYVTAAINLYSQQVSLGINKEPHPRGNALNKYLDSLKREDRKRKRSAFEDRAAGTIQHGYSREVWQRINQYLLEHDGQVAHATRTRLDHVFGFSIMARGESMRQAQLPDLFCLPLPGEGAQDATAVVLIMDNGKTNVHGRIDYGACLRAKDVVECPQGALAIYLFERFHLDGEPFPKFEQREDWYLIHLLKTSSATSPLTYSTHYRILSKVQDALDIHTSKKTHLNRGGAARFAEEGGASEGEIRRAGRWNVQEMQGCYLTGLPRKAMRTLAGFPTKPGSYHLPRATISPPAALLAKIWPSIEQILPLVEQGKYAKDLAAQGFMRLLVHLRTVLVQDAAVLQRFYPNLRFLQHPLFKDPLFLEFAASIQTATDKNERPLSVALHDAMPDLHRYVSDMARDQQAANLMTQHTNSTILQLAGLVQQSYTVLMNEVAALANREIKVTVHVEQHPASSTTPSSVVGVSRTVEQHLRGSQISSSPLAPPPVAPLPPGPSSHSSLSLPQRSHLQPPSSHALNAGAQGSGPPVRAVALIETAAVASFPPSPPSASSSLPLLLTPADHSSSSSSSSSSEQPQHEQQPQPQQQDQQQQGNTTGEALAPATSSPSLSPSARAQFPSPSAAAFALPEHPALALTSAVEQSTSTSVDALPPPSYSQSRALSSIEQVWQEYERGINGGPAVKDLEEKWHHRWRSGVADRKFFSQRNKLYTAIRQVATAKRITEEKAAVALDKAREALKKSVDWSQKNAPTLVESVVACSSGA